MLRPNFNKAEFFDLYWQKKPILISNFFSKIGEFTSPKELVELACNAAADSRIVTTHPSELGINRYALTRGPFEPTSLPALSDGNWTLLLQSAELWIPDLQEMMQAFEFLPRWRIEDVMVSFATAGGGVGPHFDQYDVFLVQGAGQRTWYVGDKIDLKQQHPSLLKTTTGLNLINEIEVKHDFTLVNGDVLYIPAGYAHWGISQSPSTCYSVGFRAPSYAELIESFSNRVMDQLTESQRFADQTDSKMSDSAEIAEKDWQHAWKIAIGYLMDQSVFLDAFGSLVTEVKYPELIEPLTEEVTPEELISFRGQAVELLRNPASRFAYSVRAERARLVLFVDGEVYELDKKNQPAIRQLCASELEDIFEINGLWHSAEGLGLVCQLVQAGALYLAET